MSKGRHRADTPVSGPSITRRAMLVTPAAGIALAAIVAATNKVSVQPTDNTAALTINPIPPAEEIPTAWYEDLDVRKSDLQQFRVEPAPKKTSRTEKRVEPVHKTQKKTAEPQAQRRPEPTTTNSHLDKRAQILALAKAQFGIPYVWGGTTRSGFDCSGLTQYVYSRSGLYLPRTSRAQGAYMVPVRNPKPGDLVFFGSPIHHVGIYVGPNRMINAPHKGAVVGYSDIWRTERYFYARHPKMF